jgi:hypothetical protein
MYTYRMIAIAADGGREKEKEQDAKRGRGGEAT